mgnify:FL=1
MVASKLSVRGVYFSGSILAAGLLFMVVMSASSLHLHHLPQWLGWIALGIVVNFSVSFPVSVVWQKFSKKLEQEIGDSTQLYLACTVRMTKAAVFLPSRILKVHRQVFSKRLVETGAVGLNLRSRHQGRQAGHRRRGGHAVKKTSSDDPGGDGGEEESPQQDRSLPALPEQQSFFSFQSAARILDCSPKTLRNKVSAGKIPAPIQTAVGPRFTADSLQAIIHPPKPVVVPPARPRGRPRISASNGEGGAA